MKIQSNKNKFYYRTQFANRMISNTIWKDAVEAGHRDENCAVSYPKCMPENLDHFARKIRKFAKMKK